MAEARTVPPARDVELMVGTGVRGRALEGVPFAAAHVDTEVRGFLGPGIGLVGRVGFDIGQADRSRGEVRGWALTAGGGLAWRWRARPVIGLGGSVVLSGGYAHLRGRPDRAGTPAASTGGATGELSVGLGPRITAGRFRLDIDGEVGGMLRSPQGTVAREAPVSMGGLWVGVALRLGASLGRRR